MAGRLAPIATHALDAPAEGVPAVGGPDVLTVVDGPGFAVSDRNGDMRGGVHGYVHADRRHLSEFSLRIDGEPLAPIASATPAPFEALVVHRLRDRAGERPGVVIRRRTLGAALTDRVELWATGSGPITAQITMRIGADFAHIFDVKAGLAGTPAAPVGTADGVELADDAAGAATTVRWDRPPAAVNGGTLTWELRAGPHDRDAVAISVVPNDRRAVARIALDHRSPTIQMRDLAAWRRARPAVTSTDPRLGLAVDQSAADLLALQLRDADHPDRVLVAAGAPWFMTLFGRDSLLTAWMTLPFDAALARGVLLTLADLQGRRHDPAAEEEPGKILHEVRHGGGGPFTDRARYYGSVDATPLFLMVAAEAVRWGALDDGVLRRLAPAIEAAVGWLHDRGVPQQFLTYHRRAGRGLSNQGWKDSWDGVTFADGRLPEPPIALVEVQGYAYAALLGAADLAEAVPGSRLDPIGLRAEAERMRRRFDEHFWARSGFYVLGLDAAGRQIDSLTSNPGHALWTGIADAHRADQYLDRLLEPELWSGWGVRTLATGMGASDPMSYHNGSVWPHDTAICAAGAARYGRWDVVDVIVEGALDATADFGGRPPELFAGFDRDDVPVPVSYPASCSPQAWSSASTLLLLRSMLGLDATATGPLLGRVDLQALEGLTVHGVRTGARRHDITIVDGQPQSRLIGDPARHPAEGPRRA